jgi:hypothetical protein
MGIRDSKKKFTKRITKVSLGASMSSTLLVVERVVLESLEKRELLVEELKSQTGFSSSLLSGVLHLLINRGIVKKNNELYGINWERKGDWLNIVQNKDGVKAELRELFSVMVNQERSRENILKVQKVWLEPSEKQELERKWKEIESYLANLKEKRKRKPIAEKTIGKQVLVFGVSPYESLVDGILKSA